MIKNIVKAYALILFLLLGQSMLCMQQDLGVVRINIEKALENKNLKTAEELIKKLQAMGGDAARIAENYELKLRLAQTKEALSKTTRFALGETKKVQEAQQEIEKVFEQAKTLEDFKSIAQQSSLSYLQCKDESDAFLTTVLPLLDEPNITTLTQVGVYLTQAATDMQRLLNDPALKTFPQIYKKVREELTNPPTIIKQPSPLISPQEQELAAKSLQAQAINQDAQKALAKLHSIKEMPATMTLEDAMIVLEEFYNFFKVVHYEVAPFADNPADIATTRDLAIELNQLLKALKEYASFANDLRGKTVDAFGVSPDNPQDVIKTFLSLREFLRINLFPSNLAQSLLEGSMAAPSASIYSGKSMYKSLIAPSSEKQ